MNLRPYQSDIVQSCLRAIKSRDNTMIVSPTGSGKTIMMRELIKQLPGSVRVIAHRSELIMQISRTLALGGIHHTVVAPHPTVKQCMISHLEATGKSYVKHRAPVSVVSVQTAIRRTLPHPEFWITDECHHITPNNIWGKLIDRYPHSRGIGFTATPLRLDGVGLSGSFKQIIQGPTMRDLITRGHLSDFDIYAPACDIDFSQVKLSASGDLNHNQLSDATHKSKRLVGDIVECYNKHGRGKRGLTFCVDIKAAKELEAAYNAAGVPARTLSSNTPHKERVEILQLLRNGTIRQVCNVDLLGEGVDIPELEVITLARRTESLCVFMQQVGRGSRLAPGKNRFTIIDHVGNVGNMVNRYGRFDTLKDWNITSKERARKAKSTSIKTHICPSCTGMWFASEGRECLYCKTSLPAPSRNTVEEVGGDLFLLTFESVRDLMVATEKELQKPIPPYHATPLIVNSINKRWSERIETVNEYEEKVRAWALREHKSASEAQRSFYDKFNIDVISAKALPKSKLNGIINEISNI